MGLIAIKMLFGKKIKLIGLLFGVCLSCILIMTQVGIFIGFVNGQARVVNDVDLADIWVMNSKNRSPDRKLFISSSRIYEVKSIEGVEWAEIFYDGGHKIVSEDGHHGVTFLRAIDENSLIGCPKNVLEGNVDELKFPNTAFMDVKGKKDFMHTNEKGEKVSIEVGDWVEISGKRLKIVGISDDIKSFDDSILLTTSYDFIKDLSFGEPLNSMIVVKVSPGANAVEVNNKINQIRDLKSYLRDDYKQSITDRFLNSGIAVNFAITISFGIFIGVVIVGQIFYNFIMDYRLYFALLKTMGASKYMLNQMIILQATIIAVIGYSIGIGVSSFIFILLTYFGLAISLPYSLAMAVFVLMLSICLGSAMFAARQVTKIEPAMALRGSE